MLGKDPFRWDLLRKYQMVFGTLFNDIRITRTNSDDTVEQLYRVPLSYAPKEKILARVLGDPGIDRKAATLLPRMSFEMTGITYNGDNKLRSVGRHAIRIIEGDDDELIEQLNPTPYDLHFTLWVFTKYIEDGQQIVEQILPYFTPQFTATVNLLEGVNLDCQVLIKSCVPQDLYASGDYSNRRGTMWTLEFTVTGYLFGPVRRHPVIKFANVSLYSATSNNIQDDVGRIPAIDRVTVQPGLTANGDPTTNVDLSVDYTEISAGDDWDYIVTISGSLVPGDIGGNEGEA